MKLVWSLDGITSIPVSDRIFMRIEDSQKPGDPYKIHAIARESGCRYVVVTFGFVNAPVFCANTKEECAAFIEDSYK